MANSYKDDETLKDVSKIKTVLRLLSALLKYKWQIAVVLVLVAIGTVLSLVNPLFMRIAIDKYIAARDMKGFIKLLIIAVACNAVLILAIKGRMSIMAKLTNKVIADIRDRLFVHLQKMDLSWFDERPSGKILSRITGDVNALKDVIENSVTSLVPNFVTVIAVVVIMFAINPVLALFSLTGLPVLTGGLVFVTAKAHRYWQLKSKKNSNLNAFVNEGLSGIKVIQGFSAEKETKDTMDDLVNQDRSAFIKAVRWADANFAIIDLSWGICIFFMYFGAIKVMGVDNISVGELVAFSSYIAMFWQPIMNLSQFYNQLITSVSKAERIFEVIDTNPRITDKNDACEMETIKGSVEFKNVTFAYEGINPVTGEILRAEKNVLENASFKVEPGETIALVGPTGAGKSTIVNLISRFYDIQEGQILVDGHDVRDVTLQSLRGQMGIMTQDNYIFSGTIRENILYGKPDATQEDVIKAAKAVCAHDFISKLPDGYETKLTSRGTELSNGQRQLIAFARTMISEPKILILDEATSSIDTKTEMLVQKGIEQILKDRTAFVIAHRLSTIQNASRIFYVDKGGIQESGTARQLMAKKGLYYRLIKASK
ncbi:MAG: ABC transporter ATP-binding protein/permease [Treponema sp.]|nr:ABC transporter ATP-binding protein/permease [Treponema sp.]